MEEGEREKEKHTQNKESGGVKTRHYPTYLDESAPINFTHAKEPTNSVLVSDVGPIVLVKDFVCLSQ